MKITERGQVTIPKGLRTRYGFSADVEVEFEPVERGLLLRRKTGDRHPVDRVRGILKKRIDVDAYIEEVRGR